MTAAVSTVDRIRLLIADVLSIDVPDAGTDMIEAGLLDSLGLVSLIAEIENEFQLELPLEDLDVNHFRSAVRIAQLLAASSR
jgi:acyl carrier protein